MAELHVCACVCMCTAYDTVCKHSGRYLQWVITALLSACVYILCMTLLSVLILTVGHDSIAKCVCVCVCVHDIVCACVCVYA